MDNAVKALEYAFAILIFVIALSASMYMLSQVKASSDVVFAQIDTKHFYQDAEMSKEELNDDGTIKYNGRIVNVETIVATLYRDYKENYIIEFYDKDNKNIIKFDLSEENRTRQLWTGNPEVDVKKRLDLFLNGSSTGIGIINNQEHDLNNDIAFVKNDTFTEKKQENSDGEEETILVINKGKADVINSTDKDSIVKHGLYNYCKDKRFIEEYAYVLDVNDQKLDEEVTKIVIRYKEVSKD